MKLDQIELHDAVIRGMSSDYIDGSIVIEVDYYQNDGDKNRQRGKIIFEEVDLVNQISDFSEMKKNAFAGNINYWMPALDTDISYIYLIGGCISIKSNKVRFENG